MSLLDKFFFMLGVLFARGAVFGVVGWLLWQLWLYWQDCGTDLALLLGVC